MKRTIAMMAIILATMLALCACGGGKEFVCVDRDNESEITFDIIADKDYGRVQVSFSLKDSSDSFPATVYYPYESFERVYKGDKIRITIPLKRSFVGLDGFVTYDRLYSIQIVGDNGDDKTYKI